jgi:hypothetical protein
LRAAGRVVVQVSLAKFLTGAIQLLVSFIGTVKAYGEGYYAAD